MAVKAPKPMSSAIGAGPRTAPGGAPGPDGQARRPVTVKLPQGLLDEMDEYCERNYVTRTALVIGAVVEYVRARRG